MIKKSGKGGGKKGKAVLVQTKGEDVFLEQMISLEQEERRRRIVSVGELTVVLTPPEGEYSICLSSSVYTREGR